MAVTADRFRSAVHQGDVRPGMALPKPFPLLRWFALLSAAAILLVSVSVTLFLSHYVERASLMQSVDGLTEMVNGIVEVEGADHFFLQDGSNDFDNFGEFLIHLGKLPGVLRANVYDRDGVVLWSSDVVLVGRRFADNDELEAALAGQAMVSMGRTGAPEEKAEHRRLGAPGAQYVENYLPVWSYATKPRKVIGAIELYRRPVHLLGAIQRNQERIWWGAVATSIVLYLAQFVIVARAARLMLRQQAELVATEKLAMAGEMASAVAHGLRNPLASIRSTAELGLESEDPDEVRGLLAEVVHQSDRLEGWIRQYLTAARAGPVAEGSTDVGFIVAETVALFSSTLTRRRVVADIELLGQLPPVDICPVLLRQILNSILANAVEAMADGGHLSIHGASFGRYVVIEIGDTGPGMSAEEIEAALKPFATTKPAGLGLGIPLARETVERHGGALQISSKPGVGTRIRLLLPAVILPPLDTAG